MDGGPWGGGVALIGAGCSVSAGVPSAIGIVDLALRHLAHVRLGQPAAAASDPRAIYDELKKDGLDLEAPYGPDLYHELFDRHLDEANEQRALIGKAIASSQGKINWAHLRLGQLVAERYVHTVITTNFDQLALEGIVRNGLIPAVADGFEALNRIDSRPAFPQLVHLHGSLQNYSLRTNRRHAQQAGHVSPTRGALYGLLRDAPFLLVAGYRGDDEDFMRPLHDALAAFPQCRVFWALRAGVEAASRQAAALRDTGCRLQFIPGQDADDLFDSLASGARLGAPPWLRDPVAVMRKEHRRIAEPAAPTARHLLERHVAELGALDACLATHRARNEPGRREAAPLERPLPANDFAAVRRTLEDAGGVASAESWMRFAVAVADAAPTVGEASAREHLRAAVGRILKNPRDHLNAGQLSRVGSALVSLGDEAPARAVFERMRDEAESAGAAGEGDLSMALSRLAGLAADRGDKETAQRLCAEALAIQQRLPGQPGAPDGQSDLALVLGRVADVAQDSGDREAAEQLHREALAIRRRLAGQLGTLDAQRDLCASLDRVADMTQDRADKEAAERLRREALAIHRRLAEQPGTPDAQRELAVALGQVADLAQDRGDREVAEELHREALAIHRRLAGQVGTVDAQRDLSVALGRVADLTQDRGDKEAAEQFRREALAIHRRLAEQLGTLDAQRDLSVTLARVADLAQDRGNTEAAEQLYQEALAIRLTRADLLGTQDAQRGVSFVRRRIANLARDRGDPGERDEA
ncbi:tetratricopeptide repeat protein [Rhodopila globiformis]|uniref:tetratricopeptide repeat protein n=1 Tax=Rhodopila globiformis TaxID=1071 RepID=UPI0011B011CE|nr:tetratricopeptide repeat protein [Rhodopila globiformis]